MPIDSDLLQQARAAEERVIEAERDADVARADFHRAVRRMQLAGGSLREIAEALGLSHQRVHQIVEGAGGGRPWRVKVPGGRGQRREERDHERLCCSFCGKRQRQVKKLIAGPKVYICDGCIDLTDQVITTGEPAATPLSAVASVGPDVIAAKCSFCGKRRGQVTGIAAAAGGAICTECLVLCHEIVTEELGR